MNRVNKNCQQFNLIMDNEKSNSKEKLLLLAIFISYIIETGCIFYYAINIVPTGKMTVTSKMIDTSKKTVQKENNIYIFLKFIDDSIDKTKLTEKLYNKLKYKFCEVILNKNILNLDNYISNVKGRKALYLQHI